MAEMLELMMKLKRESEVGGELVDLPCPLCGRPRSQRSDYIRCTPCGMNWLIKTLYQEAEDLNSDPRIARYRQMVKARGVQRVPAGTDTKTVSSAGGNMVGVDSEG